jgi:hypothetical protein
MWMCCVVAAETRAAQPEERGARKQQHGFAKLRNFSNFHFTRVGWKVRWRAWRTHPCLRLPGD